MTEPQLTIARVIDENFDEIIETWTEVVRGRASARGLSRPECINLMPLYLRSLGEPDLGPLGEEESRRSELVEAHLATRVRQGFDLAEIVEEFALLGRCISQLWTRKPGAPGPDPLAVEHLHAEIHMATSCVGAIFQRHMLEDEQQQKRFARRLESTSSHAIHGDVSEVDSLTDALQIMIDATGALAVTVVIEDIATGARSLSPAAGSARAATGLRAFASGLDIACDPNEATIASSDMAPEAPLRGLGVGRVLVTRLGIGTETHAAIVIAIDEARPFTSREIGRVEMLAERLALYADRTRIFTDLRRVIGDLHAERRLRERFVALLAHDLRNPLGAALGYAHMLETPDPPLPTGVLASRVGRLLGRVDEMVGAMLDAARIHAGETPPLQVAEHELRSLVRDALEEMDGSHPGRCILEPGPEVRGWFGARELRRAVSNLVANAIKYGAKDGPVRVAVRQDDAGAAISVHNEGPPIPSVRRHALFEPFARGAEHAASASWGLGLTLVRGAALAHGGNVEIESSADKGTTFTIRVPLDARSRRSARHVAA
ncbi:MAG TPA: sensor histidine kinase [Labilithrix sp.]